MRRMFSRQLTLTLGLVLLTLLVVSLSFQFFYYRHTIEVIQEELYSTASSVADVSGLVQENTLPMQLILSFAARTSNNDTLICDETGQVIACSCGLQSCQHLGYQFSLEDLQSQDGLRYSSRLTNQVYGEKRLAVVVPVDEGSCYVVTSTDRSSLNQIMVDCTQMNLLTILLVLPLTVLVVYILVRRQTLPMKGMAQAARRLGRGQMDVRVPTGGNNTAEMDELAVAFNNMAQALAQADFRRQEFVANVSHELKTPMTTISGYIDGMLDGTIPPQQQEKYMQIISQETKRLSRLVRSMLEVSRLQAQGVSLHQRPFDLCDSIGRVLISFEQKINAKAIDVVTDLPPEGAMAYGEQDAITQVIYNLLDNAVKFCPEKGVLTLRITQTKSRKYLVAISNTGPEIDPKELPLVFDRFHKTDKSRSVDRDGVGLGLYIAKTIVCAHEEDIFVSSKDGVTEFSFTLQRA